MSWSPIALTVPQYEDANGNPYSGAVLKAYAAGTSTPISMATDSTGGTTASSIALNASGYPAVSGNVVIPHVSADYKLALYPTQTAADANSGALWTVDNIDAFTTSIAASGGSALVGYLPAGTGAVATTVQTKLREIVSVKDFGAVGDGTTNDAAAFNAAVDSLTAGGAIFIPFDTYKINSVIGIADTAGTQSNQYAIYGDGSTLSCAAGLTAGAIRWGTATLSGYGPIIYDLTFDTGLDLSADGSSNSIGIYVTSRQKGVMQSVHVKGFATGIKVEGWDVAEGFKNCELYYNFVGLDAVNLSGVNDHGINTLSFVDGLVHWNGTGIKMAGGHSNTIARNQISTNTVGVWMGYHATAVSTAPIITGNHFENNTTYDVHVGGAQPARGGNYGGNNHIVGSAAIGYYFQNIQGSPTIGPNRFSGSSGNTTYQEYSFNTGFGMEVGAGSSSRNFVRNSNFRNWSAGNSAAPDWWRLENVTVAKDTSIVKEAAQSASITSNGTYTFMGNQLPIEDVLFLRGKLCQLSAWVYAPSTNSSVQFLALADDSATYVNNVAIPKDNAWHYLTFTVTPIVTTTTIDIRAYANYSGTSDANDVLKVSNMSLRCGAEVLTYQQSPTDKDYYRDFVSVASSGTGEDTLMTTSIAAGKLGATGSCRITVAGTKAGAANNKTVKLYFGTTAITINAAANDTTDWRGELLVFNTAAAVQRMTWTGVNGTTVVQGYDTATENTANATTVKVTGECVDGGDSVTQTMMLVEYL